MRILFIQMNEKIDYFLPQPTTSLYKTRHGWDRNLLGFSSVYLNGVYVVGKTPKKYVSRLELLKKINDILFIFIF